MDDFGKLLAPGIIRLERLLPASVETVWLYLTDSDKRSTWLAGGYMDLRVGGAVSLLFDHETLSPITEDVPDHYHQHCGTTELVGTITALEPPRLLAYTWPEKDAETSEVTFELAAKGDMTALTITHRRLPNRETIVGVASGWHAHVAIMTMVLAGETPRPFWGIYDPLRQKYEALL